MLRSYPKTFHLSDGTEVVLRPMTREDGPALLELFKHLTQEDRMFLKDNVTDETQVDRWVRDLNYDNVIPILCWLGDEVVGDATLHRSRHFWTRHVAEIRVVTSPHIRRKGLGILLAREIFGLALTLKLDKITAQVAEHQAAALQVFKRLGFYQEAVLKGHIMDPQGKRSNLILMAQDVSRFFETMQDQIMDTFADRSGGY